MNFENKVVIVSGATGGMGIEVIKALSNKKCKLALFARREEKLQEISEEIKKSNSECIYMKCDVSNPEDVKKAISFTHEKFDRIDVAILTAGILSFDLLDTFNSSSIKRSMEINFFGAVYFIEHLLPIMKAQKSGIIAATSTLPDKRGVPGGGAYGASKAAISWFMESLRAEGKLKYNINFITIKPGLVKTPMTEDYAGKNAIEPEKAANYIIRGIEQEKSIIQFPPIQVLGTRFMDLLPASIYDKTFDVRNAVYYTEEG